ncbi:MAG: VOC family protein [Pseudomonadota bacterium]
MTGITKLDHVNLRTTRLEAQIAWYTEVLGFESGPRPNFPFPGAWMYRNGHALVHLVGVDAAPGEHDNLKMEHVAFASTGLAEFIAHLEQRGETYRKGRVKDFGITQINVWDADGNHLHIDFRGEDGEDTTV